MFLSGLQSMIVCHPKALHLGMVTEITNRTWPALSRESHAEYMDEICIALFPIQSHVAGTFVRKSPRPFMNSEDALNAFVIEEVLGCPQIFNTSKVLWKSLLTQYPIMTEFPGCTE